MVRALLIAVLALASFDPARAECPVNGTATVDGRPRAGLAVELRREIEWVTVERRAVVTDERGHFDFGRVQNGDYRVSTAIDGAMPDGMALECARDEEVLPISLAIRRGDTRVRGRVTDKQGRPVPGVEIGIVEAGTKDKKVLRGAAFVVVSADGRYDFELASGHTYNVTWVAPRHRFKTKTINLNPKKPAVVSIVTPDARDIAYDVELGLEPSLSGVVVDAGGAPVAKARVFIGPLGKAAPIEVDTDASGRFTTGAVAGKPFVVGAHHGDRIGFVETAALADGEHRTGLRIALAPGRTLTGTLETKGGELLPMTTVFYRARALGLWGWINTDAKGAFTLRGMPTGHDVELYMQGNGRWPTIATPEDPSVVVKARPPRR